MTAVTLKPLIDLAFSYVDQVVIGVVGMAVTATLGVVARKFHIDAGATLNARLVSIASNGAAYALSKGQALADANAMVDIKSAQVAAALQYVQAGAPGIIKSIGVTPERLTQIVESQIQKQTVTATVPVEAK